MSNSDAKKELNKIAESDNRAKCQEAVKRLRSLSKEVTLGGLKVKDLVNEGRKY